MSRINQIIYTGMALGCLILPALAHSAPKMQKPTPMPQSSIYSDGTGNNMVDKLNNAQLDQNYRGPYYFPGQKIPPFKSTPRNQLENAEDFSKTDKNNPVKQQRENTAISK
ncbi:MULTISPECIES: hypothetical protein [Acetobacter]|nr:MULTISPECIES: hypothetical protein [Acetobacter]